MDTKAYIGCGIIESYVLGLANQEEVAELEKLCLQHPEIQNAVTEFASLIERETFNDAIAPPPELQQKIFSALSGEVEMPETAVIPLHAEEQNITRRRSFKYLAAASVILLLCSASLNLFLYNNYKSATNKYLALLTQSNTLQANNNVFRTKLNRLEESMLIIKRPEMVVIPLKGLTGEKNNRATVYWNSKTKDVFLLPTRMDSTSSDKQYQLWAIVNGKPVNAGLIRELSNLSKMSTIPKAEAFAITLEQKGGSTVPTISAMYVFGKV